MSRGNKLKTCVGYWGHLLLTGNQSSMIAELQDLSIERNNFSTGVNRQSFTDSGSAALVYTSRESQLKFLICFGHLELQVCVTVLWEHPEHRATVDRGFWLGHETFHSAPQVHSLKTQQEEQEKHQPFSFTLGDLLISTSFPEFLVQLSALITKAAVVILFSTSECCVLWRSLCAPHWKILVLSKSQTLPFLPEQNLRTWKYLEQKFQMLWSGALLWSFIWSIIFLIYSRESHWKHGEIVSKQETEKKPKNSVMSIYVHMKHFLVLIMLSQTLCLMLVILSVALKSHKKVYPQHVQSF